MLYASNLFREEKSDFRGEKTRVTITHTDHCSLLYRVFRSRVLSLRKKGERKCARSISSPMDEDRRVRYSLPECVQSASSL